MKVLKIIGLLMIVYLLSFAFGSFVLGPSHDDKDVYIMSHNPRGGPWIVEIWWKDKEIWIPLTAYNSKLAAYDVIKQLESGGTKAREIYWHP